MFSRAEMMFETSFQNDVVSLRTQTQKKKRQLPVENCRFFFGAAQRT